MLFVDKSTDQITFKNRTLLQQFRNRYGDERELERVLLDEMKFEVVQKIQQIRSQKKLSLQGARNNSNWISTSRYLNASIMMDAQSLFQPQSLSKVLNNFTKGLYNECLDSAINSLELYCQHQWSDGKIQQFQASLVDNIKDDELIVIIHDITRQNELQQLIIKDEFKAKVRFLSIRSSTPSLMSWERPSTVRSISYRLPVKTLQCLPLSCTVSLSQPSLPWNSSPTL